MNTKIVIQICSAVLLLMMVQIPAHAFFDRFQDIIKKSRSSKGQWLPVIKTQKDFDKLSRTYFRGRFYSLPHVMFLIDKQKNNKVYYINSKHYKYHRDFSRDQYKSLVIDFTFYHLNYSSSRRFYLGTIAYQSSLGIYTFEYFGADKMTADALVESHQALLKSFFKPLYFKPNSLQHEKAARAIKKLKKIPVVTENQLGKKKEYQAFNYGSATGRLRIINDKSVDNSTSKNEIVLYQKTPIFITPVEGIILSETTSPLSHVNLLASSWKIPSARIKNAESKFAKYADKYITLTVNEYNYSLKLATKEEIAKVVRRESQKKRIQVPKPDLTYLAVTPLNKQRAKDSVRFGAKAANLGEIMYYSRGFSIPDGFSIPFSRYKKFIRANNLENKISNLIRDRRFKSDREYRKLKLKEIRKWISNGKLDVRLKNEVLLAAQKIGYKNKGVFVRSSTNAEDLPDFVGAGLYATVPNVKNKEHLFNAIKTVFSSVWNFKAYEAREHFGLDHLQVYPSVLIQVGINADSAGVMITRSPFGKMDNNSIYINAKRGLGIKVVEGKNIPEQILYDPKNYITRVLTRSSETSMLRFSESGGLKKVSVKKDHAVLSEKKVQLLVKAALGIRFIFGGRQHQDIEWLFKGGKLFIVQVRPYVRK